MKVSNTLFLRNTKLYKIRFAVKKILIIRSRVKYGKASFGTQELAARVEGEDCNECEYRMEKYFGRWGRLYA